MKNNRIPLLWLLAGLVVVCTLIVIAIYFSVETTSKDSILSETAKSFIQLGTIGVLGAFVKFAFDQISESQRKRQADIEVKREMLERLRNFKKVVKAIPYYIEEERTVEAYHREMKVLLNTYMEIGDFGNDTRLLEFIHPYNERIGIHVWMMSMFVSEILDEAANSEQEIKSWEQVTQLPKYNHYRKAALDFRGVEDKSNPYKIDYDAHYDAIKTELKLLIAERRSPRWNQTKGFISSLSTDEDNKNSGIYQIKFDYFYYVEDRKVDSSFIFKSFYKRVIDYGFEYFSKVEEPVTVYYDPMNLEVSVVMLP